VIKQDARNVIDDISYHNSSRPSLPISFCHVTPCQTRPEGRGRGVVTVNGMCYTCMYTLHSTVTRRHRIVTHSYQRDGASSPAEGQDKPTAAATRHRPGHYPHRPACIPEPHWQLMTINYLLMS